MTNEIKEILFLLHNDRLTDSGKRKLEDYITNLQEENERLNKIIDELEKDIIKYFEKEYPDRKLEDYNLKNCTYDYALVILGKLKELKEEGKK